MTDQTNPSPAAVTPAMLQAGNAVTLGDRDSGPITLTWDELTRIYCAMRAAAPVALPQKITEEMHVAAAKVLTRATGLSGLPQRMLDAMRAAAPVAPAVQAVAPKGLALVPKRMTLAMRDIVESDDWTWEDLLAAAGAITEAEYEEIAAAPVAPVEERRQLQHLMDDIVEEVGRGEATYYRVRCGADILFSNFVSAVARLLAATNAAPVAPQAAQAHMTEQQATLLNQAHDMLLAHADEQRTRGNVSAAAGAECSAATVLEMAAAWAATPVAQPLTPAQMCAGDLVSALMSIVSDGTPWGNRAASMASTARAALAKVAAAGQGQGQEGASHG